MTEPKSRFAVGQRSFSDLLTMDMKCECGRRHTIGTRAVVVKPGAVREIPRVLRELGLVGRLAVVFDKNVRPIAEESVLPVLTQANLRFEPLCLEKPGELVADLTTARELMDRLPSDADVLVSVGSGTVNDLSKYSASVRGLPYVSVATAPSMNGYTSSITALTAGKFKTTQETSAAVAVIADVDILKQAPADMIRAGLGDLISKWVCNADWKLSQLVHKTYFCRVPFEMIRQQEQYYMEHASDLGHGEPTAVQALTEAIMISGFSMSIVGTSSPSSGSEHLVSHTWEMKDHLAGKPGHLHGAQVGVGTALMARLYELVAALEPKGLNPVRMAAAYPTWEEIEQTITAFYGPIAPDVLKESREKYPERQQLELELEWVLGNWTRMWQQLKPFRKSSEEIVRVLTEAGAPARPADLEIDAETTFQTIMHARFMRSRYTILDLAAALGVLEDLARRVTEEA